MILILLLTIFHQIVKAYACFPRSRDGRYYYTYKITTLIIGCGDGVDAEAVILASGAT